MAETDDGPSDPTVSVLMGVYNEEEYLCESIQSLLDQTFDDFEIIVVDDCSTDASADIVRSIADPRVTLLQNDENRGLTRSLNRALATASGTFVARQDADDRSHPTRLEREVAYLREHDDVAVVGTGAYLIDGDGTIQQERTVLRNVTFEELLEKNRVIHGSILAKRDVLESVGGYDELFRYSQDLDLWLRIAAEHTIRNIPEPLYYFRIHDESVYFSANVESMLYAQLATARATDTISDRVLKDIKENGITTYFDHLSCEDRRVFHESLAERYLRYGYPNRARKQCRKALAVDWTAPKALLLYALSYLGEMPTAVIREIVRRLLNTRTKIRNRISSRNLDR